MTQLFSRGCLFLKNLLSSAFRGPTGPGNSDSTADVRGPSLGKRQFNENESDESELICSKKKKFDFINWTDLENPRLSFDDPIMELRPKPWRKDTRKNGRNRGTNIVNSKTTKPSTRSNSSHFADGINTNNPNEMGNSRSTCSNEGRLLRSTNCASNRPGSSRTGSPFPPQVDNLSSSFLGKVHQEKQKATYYEMVKKTTIASPQKHKTLPLTTSTLHNTKQNSQVVPSTITGKGYFLRSSHPVLKRNSTMEDSLVKETEPEATVIDLTSEENDCSERSIIEANVRNSARFKNFKCSFVWNPPEEDFLADMLKKYQSKQRSMQESTKKIRQNLQRGREDFHQNLIQCLEERLVLKEHVPKEKQTKDLAPMTEDMMGEMHKILSSRQIILAQIKDTGIKLQDIRTLHDKTWLNDEIINAYMNLIKIRSEENEKIYPKVHCFNTFFYPQLLNRGYSSVRRWTKKIDIFDHAIVIVPIHLGNHWCLTEIRIKEQTIKYYDSLGSPNNQCLDTMLKYLASESEDKKGRMLNVADWRVINVPPEEIPNQRNAHDCGVFACTYAEHITRNANFRFEQEDMIYFREKMTYEILTGKLLL